jgi:hypothetical protein
VKRALVASDILPVIEISGARKSSVFNHGEVFPDVTVTITNHIYLHTVTAGVETKSRYPEEDYRTISCIL